MARVLIVDDDPDIVEAGRIVLEKNGHQVLGVHSREEGMQAIDSFKPDVLILDVMMEQPDDGIAMAQELRRNGITIPILMLTSIGKVTGMNYQQDDEMIPVDDFQEKPIDPNTLVKKINNMVGNKETN